jgi:hypothetical protein
MNTSHYWTAQEQRDLLRDFMNRKEGESKQDFSRRWAKIKGDEFSTDGVRAKLVSLLRGDPIKENTPPEPKEESSYEQGDDFINIICASRRMRSKEDVIKEFNIDLNVWSVEKYKVKTSEGYRKDRSVEWHVKDGTVLQGDVSDSGKMLVVPLYHIEVRLVRKTDEIRARAVSSNIIEDAKNYAPVYPRIKYLKQKHAAMYEISMPDLHFGRLCWGEETGIDYDIKIAASMVHGVLDKLLTYARLFQIEKILLPVGNDMFNVNSKTNLTVNGTAQQEDTRFQKTFRAGWHLVVNMIEKCSEIAPVEVVVIKGNHDEERIFYLGEVLAAWFDKNPNVGIDNKAIGRKYYLYGKNLIGFAHGSDVKPEKLEGLMPLEEPDKWAASKFREWHTGHVHHLYKLNNDAEENLGIVVRSLRSLVPADAWTFDHGFVGALRAAESFVWDKENGLVAQFTATP